MRRQVNKHTYTMSY